MLTIVSFAALLAFQQGSMGGRIPLPGGATLDPSGTPDTVQLFKRAGDAEKSFLTVWYNAWRVSEADRAKETAERIGKLPRKPQFMLNYNPRQADFSCNPPRPGNPGVYLPDHAWGVEPGYRQIRSANGRMSVCPNWLPAHDTVVQPPNIPDERLELDGALVPKARAAVTNLRGQLLALFDTAAQAMPKNGTIVGQFVRFLIDQGEIARADSVVKNCKAVDWFCSALSGYMFARHGNVVAADSAYDVAGAWLAQDDRCKWREVSALLDSAARNAYEDLSCEEQLKFNERFWWMSDPLWSIPGNDRRVEQYNRLTTILLHSSTERDERYNWNADRGGDAVEEAMRRYGWPYYAAYGMPVVSGMPGTAGNAANTLFNSSTANRLGVLAGPVTGMGGGSIGAGSPVTGGRPLGRPGPAGLSNAQFGFPAGAGSDPAHNATLETVWEAARQAMLGPCGPLGCMGMDIGSLYGVQAPAGQGQAPVAAPTQGVAFSSMEYSVDRIHPVPTWRALQDPFAARTSDWSLNPHPDTVEVRNWWPQEHYQPAHRVIQFTDQQTALLRRDRTTLLAFATNLGAIDLQRRPTDSVTTQLIVGIDPENVDTYETKKRGGTDRARFLTEMPNGPAVISVEVPWDSTGKPAARTRFGIKPPRPLWEMKRGETAISDPILLLAPPGEAALPLDPAAALEFMRGSTTISLGTRSIGVYWETYGFYSEDTLDVSLRVQRVSPPNPTDLAVTSIADNANAVTLSWQEPERTHARRVLGGTVPIQIRSILVDITTLRAGDYILETSVGRKGQTPVKSQRAFTVK